MTLINNRIVPAFVQYVRRCHFDKVKAIMERHPDAFKLVDLVTAGYATETEAAKKILDPLIEEIEETLGISLG